MPPPAPPLILSHWKPQDRVQQASLTGSGQDIATRLVHWDGSQTTALLPRAGLCLLTKRGLRFGVRSTEHSDRQGLPVLSPSQLAGHTAGLQKPGWACQAALPQPGGMLPCYSIHISKGKPEEERTLLEQVICKLPKVFAVVTTVLRVAHSPFC